MLTNKRVSRLGLSGSQEFPQLMVDVTPCCLDDASAAHSKKYASVTSSSVVCNVLYVEQHED